MTTLSELARLIDHALLHPTLTDADLREGCALAAHYGVASVCIKPYAVRAAAGWLGGTNVRVGTVIGFPHGSHTTASKVAETESACAEGAAEIDVVVNVGKVLGGDWDYVSRETNALREATRRYGATLKVIFENDYLPDDAYKIRLCEICSAAAVDFVKTSTGYGFVRGADGRYGTAGATEHDLKLMRRHAAPAVGVKAAGGIRTLDDLFRARSWGVTRIGMSATAALLEEARQRFGGAPGGEAPAAGRDVPGY
ncbi:MAG: deoxyribose-phosphate aldolase [Cytophagales bacterium]|nr:deoxyribose-phosphate aldolase [Cytophagales bacterium]